MNIQSEAALGFATGFGQSDTHVTTLSDGRANPSKYAGKPYETISGAQIVDMVKNPPSVAKEKAQWFIPSSYHAPDARTHEAQRINGTFSWLPLDLDQNNLSLKEVLDAIHCIMPDVRCMIYSSRSATEENKKWRGLIPLKEGILGTDYSDTVTAMYDLLETISGGRLIPDRALARPGQLIYLPNRGSYYETYIHRGVLALLTAESPVIIRREDNRKNIHAAESFAKERRLAPLKTHHTGTDKNPIEHFNEGHSISDLLTRFGYKQDGQSQNWRSPMQSSGSYATKNFGSYWVSLSASDAALGIGHATPNGHRCGDAFDLFVHHEMSGNFTLAVKEYVREAGLDTKNRETTAPKAEAKDSGANDEGQGDAPEKFDKLPSDWPFKVDKAGVWKRHDTMNSQTGKVTTTWTPICSELHVLAETRDAEGQEWGRLLEVIDRDGHRKRWAMPMSLMSGDGSAIRERLFSMGLVPSQARVARQALLEYIGSAEPEEKVRCVSRIGWAGGAFVLPSQTIGVF